MIDETRSSVLCPQLNAADLPCSFAPSSSTSIADRANHPSSSAWVNENFVVDDVLGSGTFGTVYRACLRTCPSRIFALKELQRGAHPRFVAMELRVLQTCGGNANIIMMHAAFRHKDRVFIVMDYFPHDHLMDFIENLTLAEKLDYIRNLLAALSFLHHAGFVHRDVKPSNFLYNRTEKRYRLIDFGLSEPIPSIHAKRCPPSVPYHSSAKRICLDGDALTRAPKVASAIISPSPRERDENVIFVRPTDAIGVAKRPSRTIPAVLCTCVGQPRICTQCTHKDVLNMNKAGTPGFRSPEMLLQTTQPNVLADIWAAGVTLLSLCCRRHPIMRPSDNLDAVFQMAVIFGSVPLEQLAKRLGSSLLVQPFYAGFDLVKFVRSLSTEDTVSRKDYKCQRCSHLFQDGLGQCMCASSEMASFASIVDPEEYRLLYVLRKCLLIDPDERYTADMLLALLD